MAGSLSLDIAFFTFKITDSLPQAAVARSSSLRHWRRITSFTLITMKGVNSGWKIPERTHIREYDPVKHERDDFMIRTLEQVNLRERRDS